ncbi:Uncharacterised protein [Enterobacter cancerogenus]|uniref:Uncharacterized protein n=1 Tax=Enterobacter cancerogenus TaxID=69218 RepID=A0A484WVI1_9ENTR|nr:Uncharacterised protein [Enterobacter cancerogenus]
MFGLLVDYQVAVQGCNELVLLSISLLYSSTIQH